MLGLSDSNVGLLITGLFGTIGAIVAKVMIDRSNTVQPKSPNEVVYENLLEINSRQELEISRKESMILKLEQTVSMQRDQMILLQQQMQETEKLLSQVRIEFEQSKEENEQLKREIQRMHEKAGSDGMNGSAAPGELT